MTVRPAHRRALIKSQSNCTEHRLPRHPRIVDTDFRDRTNTLATGFRYLVSCNLGNYTFSMSSVSCFSLKHFTIKLILSGSYFKRWRERSITRRTGPAWVGPFFFKADGQNMQALDFMSQARMIISGAPLSGRLAGRKNSAGGDTLPG